MDQSVRENIIGSRAFEPEWYARVIDACAMAPDIEGFAEGDEKNVGSGGSALSGGQKSRVVSFFLLFFCLFSSPSLLLSGALTQTGPRTRRVLPSRTPPHGRHLQRPRPQILHAHLHGCLC